ncbi:MAG: glutaredoxin family protein [Thermodesulfobacteriota bacterium]
MKMYGAFAERTHQRHDRLAARPTYARRSGGFAHAGAAPEKAGRSRPIHWKEPKSLVFEKGGTPMAAEEIKVYSTPTCPYCKMAKEFLSQKGYKFTEYDVTKDRAALDEMVKISGARSVPVIAACNEVMVGFDKTRLEQMLSCIKQRSEV